MDDKVNLAQKLAPLDKPYRPGIIGYLNDYKIVVVRARGEFTWHKHDETDDFFLVLRGAADDPAARPRRRARAGRALCRAARRGAPAVGRRRGADPVDRAARDAEHG
jgi:hypothetical protein